MRTTSGDRMRNCAGRTRAFFGFVWGSQSWLQPALSRLGRCSEKSRLKGGCRQDCLPHSALHYSEKYSNFRSRPKFCGSRPAHASRESGSGAVRLPRSLRPLLHPGQNIFDFINIVAIVNMNSVKFSRNPNQNGRDFLRFQCKIQFFAFGDGRAAVGFTGATNPGDVEPWTSGHGSSPCVHCTGQSATELFCENWPAHCVPGSHTVNPVPSGDGTNIPRGSRESGALSETDACFSTCQPSVARV